MMKVFVINGMPRAGKDTFVEMCQKHSLWCLNVSTVDFVKKLATQCGWDGTKTPENRAFLSDLKDLLTRWNDVPFREVGRAIKLFQLEMEQYDFNPDDGVVFIHCREPEEIQKFVDYYNAKTILVRREAIETKEQSNHADAEVFNCSYDFVVENNGTLDELEQKAVWFLHNQSIRVKNDYQM